MQAWVVEAGDVRYAEALSWVRRHVDFCQGWVTTEYLLNQAVPKADAVGLLVTAGASRSGPCARIQRVHSLALLRVPPQADHVYLDVQCSRGGGFRLLRAIERWTVARGRSWVQLSSVPQAINYWRKQGFRHVRPPSMREATAVRRAAATVRGVRYTSDMALHPRRHPAYWAYLQVLVDQGFGLDQWTTISTNAFRMWKRVRPAPPVRRCARLRGGPRTRRFRTVAPFS